MIVTRTPFRIPLGGGGTDLPSYYSRYGGFIVSAAINRYVNIMVNRRFENSVRLSYSQTEIVDDIDQIEHPIVREALKFTELKRNLEIVSIADLPAKAGLGSSCAFTVGLLHALHTLKREQRSPEDLAEEACYIEIDQLGGSIGKQDQYATAFGGIVCLEIDREGGVRVAPVQVPEDALQELESNVALFYTGIQRSASQVLSSQSQATSDGDPQVVEALHVIKDIGTEIKLALEKGDLVRFGWLLDEHWRVKKSLSDGVSSGQIDGWYAIGKANGAIGGKVMGAGGGGFLMFYCQNGCRSRLRQAMAAEGLKELRFAVDFEGTKVLVNF